MKEKLQFGIQLIVSRWFLRSRVHEVIVFTNLFYSLDLVDQDNPLNISMTWPTESQFHPRTSFIPLFLPTHPFTNFFTTIAKLDSLNSSPISTRRLLSGYGQERGKIGIELSNHLNRTVEVIWIETWPWWIRGFISSLKVKMEGNDGKDDSKCFYFVFKYSRARDHTDLLFMLLEVVEKSKIVKLDYTPSIARKRPTTLQILVSLPSNSITKFELDYESAYLWYTEYRSDAHRGFEIPGATLILLSPLSSSSNSNFNSTQEEETEEEEVPIELRKHAYRIHTPSTLLSIPTPDFSMPYNVIILTSTAMALFFGSVMNVFVRSWLVVNLDGEDQEEEGKVDGGDEKLEGEEEDRLVVE